MKQATTMFVLLAFAANVFAQEPVKNKDYYLAKSKRQKTAALSLLIGGAVLGGVGLLVGSGKEASFSEAGTGGIISAVGIVAMIGSIPLFAASSKNKRKASLVFHHTTLP